MYLSIIIPVYNEKEKIVADIEAADFFLSNNRINGEIIVVDDGSSDNTPGIAKQQGDKTGHQVNFKIISNHQQRGKGFAVKTGIKASSGDYVMFADSGNCIEFEQALTGLKIIESGQCDIANASRKMSNSKIVCGQGFLRKLYATAFRLVVKICFRIPSEITDTQCGFKVYKGSVARELYSKCRTDGFMFDLEILLLAIKNGFTVKEFPVKWTCDRDSRLHPGKSMPGIFAELWNIHRRLRRVD